MTTDTYFPPFLSLSQFAGFCGVTLRTVEAWVLRGHIPTLKIGKNRLVNVAALIAQTDFKTLKKITEKETTVQPTPQQKA